ncbi:hypothetical protein D3C81_2033930 [compost metagenome]
MKERWLVQDRRQHIPPRYCAQILKKALSRQLVAWQPEHKADMQQLELGEMIIRLPPTFLEEVKVRRGVRTPRREFIPFRADPRGHLGFHV